MQAGGREEVRGGRGGERLGEGGAGGVMIGRGFIVVHGWLWPRVVAGMVVIGGFQTNR